MSWLKREWWLVRPHRFVLAMIGLAAVTRLVLILRTCAIANDSCAFLHTARLFASGHFTEGLRIGYHPVYPLLIVPLGVLTGNFELSGYIVSILFASLAVVPLFFLGRSVFGPTAGYVACFLYAVLATLIDMQAEILSEGVYIFFLLWALALAWQGLERRSLIRMAASAFCATGAYLTRAEGMAAVVLIFGWVLLTFIRDLVRHQTVFLFPTVVATVLLLLCGLSLKYSQKPSVRILVGGEEHKVQEERECRPIVFVRKVYHSYTWHVLPLIVVGCLVMFRRSTFWPILYLWSYPLGIFIAIGYFFALGGWIAGRYFDPTLAVLLPVAAIGAIAFVQWWRSLRWVGVALVGLLTVSETVYHSVTWKREELVGLREAGVWLRAQVGEGKRVMSDRPQPGYYARGVSVDVREMTYAGILQAWELGTGEFFVIRDHTLVENNLKEPIAADTRFREIKTLEFDRHQGGAIHIFQLDARPRS